MKIVKIISTVLFFSLLLGCRQDAKTDKALDSKNVEDSMQSPSLATTLKNENSRYYLKQDTLRFLTAYGDTIIYGKEEFNLIVDNHPELFSKFPQEPDVSYYSNEGQHDFESEVGQDEYYILYAYLLEQRNKGHDNKIMRKKLIEIYTNINLLFQRFQHGGTYFMHQYSRILGYAEYSIYLNMLQNKDTLEKSYDITKQKEYYLKSLRQLIIDETRTDNEILEKDRKAQIKELNKKVDELNDLITDNFYLRRAQEFQYGHY